MPKQASPPSALEQQQRDVIVSIARGAPLHAVLERLVGLMELLTPNGYGTVLLLDPDGIHTRHGAAPHIAPAFARAIDGACIGPHEGSCGAAAYLKRRIIVEDIATHPNWTNYRDVALAAGLRACWSTPIFGADGVVLGTFAIYYTEPRRPTEAEIAGIDLATYLASIALERERAQASLRAGEQLYRLVYENVSDVIFQLHVERDGRFRFAQVNPAFSATTGLARDDVVGKYVDEVIPPSSHALAFAAYRAAVDERRSVSWEEVSDYPSGRKYGHVQVYPVFDALGVCTDLIGTVHDVTAYKLAADKIAAQASLLDQARDAIAVLDLAGTVHYWNEGAHQLYGVPAEQAVGQRLSALVESDARLEALLSERLLCDGEASAELRRKTHAGVVRVVNSRSTLVRDEQGQPVSRLLIETDVTAQRSAEAEFQRAQRIESLGVLAGGIAHDFNNILSGMLGHVDLARESGAGGQVERALAEIEKAAWRAADLTRRILTFGRKVESSLAPLDVRVPLAEAAALLQATVLPPTRLSTRLGSDLPLVLGDATAIHQLVMNLGTNAVHAVGERGGHIELQLGSFRCGEPRRLTLGQLQPGSYVVISVRDDGVGMDDTTLERIFEPYFTTRAVQGTGLGLSVVHGIVTSHGGALEVISKPGAGTTFRVFLPVIEPAPGFGTDAITDLGSAQKGQGELALFVDDEEAIVALARELLPPRGYRVDAFASPLAALRAFESNPTAYSVLVTDSAMHGMTGQQLVRAVRALRPELPVVVSSSSVVTSGESFEALGVREVLSKPVRFHQIAAAIERALGRA